MKFFGSRPSGAKARDFFANWMDGLKPVPFESVTRPNVRIRELGAIILRSLLVAAVVCISLGATDSSARFDDLGHKMMCTCGCGQVLLECNHVGCTRSGGMREELTANIASGLNDSLVLQKFVKKYGATVLAAPTTQGFDLLAWIMPFAVSFVALLGTIFLVRHWAQNQPKLAGATGGVVVGHSDEEMRERIRRETGTE